MHRNNLLASASVLATVTHGLTNDVAMFDVPQIRTQWNSSRIYNPTNLAQMKERTENNRQVPDGFDERGAPLSFTDDMLEMIPVPFEGDEYYNPHNDALASEDSVMLLDIPDVIPDKRSKSTHSQQRGPN